MRFELQVLNPVLRILVRQFGLRREQISEIRVFFVKILWTTLFLYLADSAGYMQLENLPVCPFDPIF
jgi:hypothetical protein